MDIFSQNKFLIRTILFLVILNLVSITFFSIRSFRPKNDDRLPPKNEYNRELSEILKKELNLSEYQIEKFEKIRTQNEKRKIELKEIINQNKDLLASEMFKNITDEKKVLAIAKKIGDNEYQIELLKINQSKQLKAICTPAQLDKFDELIKEIRNYLQPINRLKKN